MKKNLILLLLLFPALLFAQRVQEKDGTISIDFGKKKKQEQDTIQKQKQDTVKVKKETQYEEEEFVKPKVEYDYKEGGIFKALFHVGINASQIDGVQDAGYKYVGFHGGIGTMVRFHKNVSASVEMNYSMKGDKTRNTQNPRSPQKYIAALDYIDIPVSVNLHDKKFIMFSIGMTPAFLVRYKQIYSSGYSNVISTYGTPNRFDLLAFFGLHSVIRKHFMVGGKFSYSVIKLRSSTSGKGQYNNVITFRFVYILDQSSSKKKR